METEDFEDKNYIFLSGILWNDTKRPEISIPAVAEMRLRMERTL